MEQSSQKTGIIYCRVSSSEQIENTSLESQERACREFAERQSISVVEPPFIERGESAKSANRTEFQKAIARCADKKQPISYFIVFKLDRFARNQDDHVTVRALLKRYGTELRSVTEPINETPVGRAMEGMISVFAEFDNNIRTERTRGGMLARARQGFWCWQAPLGYYRTTKKANITQNTEIAPYIQLAFEEWSKGIYTYESLAHYLDDRGMRTRYGKKPSSQLIEKILKNEIYCGVIDAFGERNEAAFAPIVSKELFARCQKNKASLSGKRAPNNPLFPLRKLVLCSECAQIFTGSSSRGKMGKRYPYYHHQKQNCPLATSIPKSTFEQLFVEFLDSITPNAKFEKLFRAVILNTWQNSYKKLDQNNARIRREIDGLETERQRIFDLHRESKYTDNEFQEQKKLVNERISQKYQLVEDNRIEEFDMDLALNYCFEHVRETAKRWEMAKFGKKLRLQGLIFDGKVYFDGKQFGTQELSSIYRLNQEYGGKKSSLVAPRGIEPRLPA